MCFINKSVNRDDVVARRIFRFELLCRLATDVCPTEDGMLREDLSELNVIQIEKVLRLYKLIDKNRKL